LIFARLRKHPKNKREIAAAAAAAINSMKQINGVIAVTQHLLGSTIGLGVLVVFLLIMVAVTRHPGSVQGDGIWLLWLDSGLLAAYAATAFWLWKQSSPRVTLATSVGMKFGALEMSRRYRLLRL